MWKRSAATSSSCTSPRAPVGAYPLRVTEQPPTPAWHAQLRARGYRLTPQRQLVLEAVASLGHATPDEIADRVRLSASGVNISTVYRTLELLEELGLVTHTHLGHGAPTYHAADDADHLHLVCRVCGGIEEVPPAVLDSAAQRIAADHGFAVDASHFAVFGTCSACSDA
jgi:Fur family transcriptional regulator, ferric uptake regulator